MTIAPRVAFGAAENEPFWGFTSGQSHAEFAAYVNLSAAFDEERGVVHTIGPNRDSFKDSIWLWLAARHLARVLASLLTVHPQLDATDFLTAMGPMHAAEERVNAESAEREGSGAG